MTLISEPWVRQDRSKSIFWYQNSTKIEFSAGDYNTLDYLFFNISFEIFEFGPPDELNTQCVTHNLNKLNMNTVTRLNFEHAMNRRS